MIHNLYIDLCTYLDGGGIGKPNKSQPITFLTQWKLVGNSEVIGEQILSCGDLQDDGKYHVLIKADSRVIDIPLDEPLRKVGNVGDTIEFPTDTPNIAKVTRNYIKADYNKCIITKTYDSAKNHYRYRATFHNVYKPNLPGDRDKWLLSSYYPANLSPFYFEEDKGIAIYSGYIYYYDSEREDLEGDEMKQFISQFDLIYRAATPIVEYISVPNIPLAKTYSSANQVPYSEFSYEHPNTLYIDGEPMTDEDGNHFRRY